MIPLMTPITILIAAMILDSLMGEPKPLWQRLPPSCCPHGAVDCPV